MGVCNCSMFCCTLLCHLCPSSFATQEISLWTSRLSAYAHSNSIDSSSFRITFLTLNELFNLKINWHLYNKVLFLIKIVVIQHVRHRVYLSCRNWYSFYAVEHWSGFSLNRPENSCLYTKNVSHIERPIRAYKTRHLQLSQCMDFPTMWQFDKCRLGRASAVSL